MVIDYEIYKDNWNIISNSINNNVKYKCICKRCRYGMRIYN